MSPELGKVIEEEKVRIQGVQGGTGEPGAGEKNSALLSQIGSLKLYEIVLAMLFLSVIFSWNPYITL